MDDQGIGEIDYVLTPDGRPIKTLEYFLPNRPFTKEKLRACLNCGLIKHFLDFRREGCNNCDKLLKMKNDSENIILFTSLTFEGVVGITEHCRSWNSRYFVTVNTFCPGIYAVHVVGSISDRDMSKILFPHAFESDSEDERNTYHSG